MPKNASLGSSASAVFAAWLQITHTHLFSSFFFLQIPLLWAGRIWKFEKRPAGPGQFFGGIPWALHLLNIFIWEPMLLFFLLLYFCSTFVLFLKRKLFFFFNFPTQLHFFFSFKFPLVIKLRMLIHGKNEKGPVEGAGELKVRGDALEGRGAPAPPRLGSN